MLVVPQSGNAYLQEVLRASFNASALKLQLYQNDIFPTLDSVVADFSPCTFPRYAPIVPTWPNPPILDPTLHYYLQADPITFLCVAQPIPDQRAFGYFVTNGGGTAVVWAERFEKRMTLRKAGQKIKVFLLFGSLSEFTG